MDVDNLPFASIFPQGYLLIKPTLLYVGKLHRGDHMLRHHNKLE